MTVHCAGVVGGGTMGQGIAITCASAGLDVLLRERTPELGAQALVGVAETLDREIAKWRRTESEKRAVLARVRVVETFAALEAAQVVVEAVSESLELKAGVFQELDRVCPPEDIQPVPQVPLVEVVRGLATSDETYAAALEFVRILGKTGIEVFESPGYVTTRVILPFLNEAMHVVMEGVATAEAVDTSMRLGYGLPVGPLSLADRMGLDEVNRWLHYLFTELGEVKYRPCPLLRKMIRAGHLGVKTSKGFFEYDEHGNLK